MRTDRNKNWYAMFRGDVYAIQLFDCNTLEEAKKVAREFLGVSRLPNGTEVYSSMVV